MKRLRPLSHSLALLAATNMSLAPALAPLAFADMQTATDTSQSLYGDESAPTKTWVDPSSVVATATTTTTTTDEAGTTTTATTTTVTTDNLEGIIKSLTSNDVQQIQTRYNELLDLIKSKKLELIELTDAADITAAKTELANMENLAAAFKAILEGYKDSGAKTVTKTESYVDPETGDKVTRTTYSDGSYTETVETNTATDDDDSEGFNDYSDSGSGGGGGDFLQKMLENPIVQGMIAGLLQKLMNGGLGNLSSLLGGATAQTPQNGDTLLGKVCDKKAGQKCEAAEYNTPSPSSKSKAETRKTTTSTIDAINTTAAAAAAATQNQLQGVPAGLGGVQKTPTGVNGRVPGSN